MCPACIPANACHEATYDFACSIDFGLPLGPVDTHPAACVRDDDDSRKGSGRLRERRASDSRQHCYQCHGPEKQKSGYRLDRRDIAFKGGEFGEPAIVPSQAGESPLLKYVRGEVDGTEMPPNDSGIPALNEQQVATLQSWIEQGAVWPDEHSGIPVDSGPHWSLAPLTKPDVPNVESTTGKSSAMNPVDAFVVAKLREKNLTPSKPRIEGR